MNGVDRQYLAERRKLGGFQLNPRKLLLVAQKLDRIWHGNGYCKNDNGIIICGGNDEINKDIGTLKKSYSFAFMFDSNFSCRNFDDIYQYTVNSHLYGEISLDDPQQFYDNYGMIDDQRDACLAVVRDELQKWLDASLGAGTATILPGGVSVMLTDLYNKTMVKFTLNKDVAAGDTLDISGNTSFDVAKIEQQLAKNAAAWADFHRVKTLKLPAALFFDYEGRPNSAVEINLGQFAAVRDIMREADDRNQAYEYAARVRVTDVEIGDH